MGKYKDLTGEVVGNWTVLDRDRSAKKGNGTHWVVRCSCGTTKILRAGQLNGRSLSCGCTRPDVMRKLLTKHGLCGTPEYEIWKGIRTRCFDKNHRSYKRYGAVGITLCERWNDFENFIEDVGLQPSPNHSIDRIDSKKNYEPGNVRWATPREQANNTCRNRFINYNGTTLTMAEWARKLGIAPQALQRRLARGWSVEKSLTQPLGRWPKPPSTESTLASD